MREIILYGIKTILWVLSVTARPLAVTLAFRLFCYPHGRSKVRAGERNMMLKAQRETVTVRGHAVCVYRWGNGQHPVLMVHGWESRGARFAPMAERLLARGYSPITFDSPGHGDSGDEKTTILDYRDICRVLHRQYGDFDGVIAHSFGALGAFLGIKEAVGARCVVSIGGVSDFRYLLDAFSEQLSLRAGIKESLRQRIEELFLPIDDIWNRFSVTHATEAMAQPVLVIHDQQDTVVRMEQAQRTASHFGARARLHVTDGLGHNRILRDKKVINLVVEFIHDACSCDESAEPERLAG